MEDFPYFSDPLHFAHLADPGTPCDFCGDIGAVFDAQGFYGTQPLDAICSVCLKGGRLAEVGASNERGSGGGTRPTSRFRAAGTRIEG